MALHGAGLDWLCHAPKRRLAWRTGAPAAAAARPFESPGTGSFARPWDCGRIGRRGFVLRAEKLDAKTLIHNYGHGGAGMSLSWGTGQMAAELALEQADRRAAVLGCGVVGLTTARQLQRRGFDVTIYAAAVPPDTTSNMSLAGFTPTSGLVDDCAAHAGMGRAVPPRRRDRVSSAAAAGRSEVRHLVDLQLLARPSEPQSARGTNDAAARFGADGIGRAGPGRASVSLDLRHRAARDAHRAVDLSRRARAGRRGARRQDQDPQVRNAARRRGSRRNGHRQLHRPRGKGAVRRSRADAAEGAADRPDSAGRGELQHQRRVS